MQPILLQAPAKINLYLYLTGKRADGYHLLESLVVFTELADTLEIATSDALSLQVQGEFADSSGTMEDNLVLRAARALVAKTGVKQGAQLRLTKNIPVGAGLGGGSADAAAALRGLNRFWNLNISQQDLQWIASTLGADVAMCLDSMPAIARGIGDELMPLMPPPPKLHVLLVHPRVPLLTKDVYAASRLGDPAPEWSHKSMKPKDFIESLRITCNHLQRPAIAVDSRVAEVLLALETLIPAANLVRMSGSGACCFALYADKEAATRAHSAIAKQHPQWWTALTTLR
jgi:4-diphosphocytidyl-2-C-methyl-D-erythritol kinase